MEGNKNEKGLRFFLFSPKNRFVKKQENKLSYRLLFVVFINATHKNGKVHTHKRRPLKSSFFVSKDAFSVVFDALSLRPIQPVLAVL